ncbi:hypothetical protein DPSP01_012325 [Paraphaeosphaeria sporulosa]
MRISSLGPAVTAESAAKRRTSDKHPSTTPSSPPLNTRILPSLFPFLSFKQHSACIGGVSGVAFGLFCIGRKAANSLGLGELRNQDYGVFCRYLRASATT